MDPRLNLVLIETQETELRRRDAKARLARRWPDDGLAPRTRQRKHRSLHPTAVLASLLTWR